MSTVEALSQPPAGAAEAVAAASAPRRAYGDPANPEVIATLTERGVRLVEDRPGPGRPDDARRLDRRMDGQLPLPAGGAAVLRAGLLADGRGRQHRRSTGAPGAGQAHGEGNAGNTTNGPRTVTGGRHRLLRRVGHGHRAITDHGGIDMTPIDKALAFLEQQDYPLGVAWLRHRARRVDGRRPRRAGAVPGR